MQLALMIYGTLLGVALAVPVTVESIGIYDSPSDPSKAILEVCYSTKECDKLLIPQKDLKSEKVVEWFDMMIKKRGAK